MSDFQNIADELKASCRWVLWRLEDQDQRKDLKVPYQAKSPKYGASHSDPDHWVSFAEATAALDKDTAWKEGAKNGVCGIGLVVGKPFVGIDLDKCRDPETGETQQWALDFLKELNTYTEISQSGKGYHCWVKGESDKDGTHKGQVEVYAKKRYLTMTGRVVQEYPTKLREFSKPETSQLFSKVASMFKKEEKPKQDSSSDNSRLQKLMAGDYEGAGFTDISQAVMSLLTQLAVKHLLDKEKIEEDFKKSGLHKDFRHLGKSSNWIEKWERMREDHLNKAVQFGREQLKAMFPKKAEVIDPNSWRQLFRTFAEESDFPFEWLVRDLIEIDSATALGGLSGHGKTLLALSLAKSLVLGTPFLNHFEVPKAYPVLYLIPESGSRSFRKRLRSFRLMVNDDRFLYRTLSHGPTVPLSDPRMLLAAKGKVVFLDTAIRFMSGDENSSTENQKYLAQDIFNLQAAGAVALVLIHHSPKAAVEKDVMTLENVLRGSGDIGAMLSNVYGVRRMDERTSLIHIERVKGRDMDDYLPPFQVEGRPWIDQEGDFRLTKKPGDCGTLREEKLNKNDERLKVWELHKAGKKSREIEVATGVSKSKVCQLIKMGDPKQAELKIEEDDRGI